MLNNHNKIKNFFTYLIFTALPIVTIFQGCSSSLNVISKESFENISSYEFGDSRKHLIDLSEKIDSLSKSVETKEMIEEDLLEILESDATNASKQFVCRKLRIIGTEKSVSVLLRMMMNDETTNMAKYALEGIHSKYIDDSLIKMLPNVNKNIKIAIINTLSVRRNPNSVTSIGEMLYSNDNEIASIAASALGKIGSDDALKYLGPHLMTPNLKLRNTILDSYLLSIDGIINQNNLMEANKFYKKLHGLDTPPKIKHASLIGIINTSSEKKSEILRRIKTEPDDLKFIPISKMRELPSNTDFTIFAKLLPILKPTNQIQMLAAFKDLGNKNIKSQVLELLKSEIQNVRIAAIKALARVGDESEVMILANHAATSSGLESNTAQASLDLLKGDKIDDTILNGISSSEIVGINAELIRAAGARNITSAFNQILGYADSESNKIKSEAFKSLANIATDKNLPILIDVMLKQETSSSRKKIERAISKIIINYPNEQTALDLINQFNSQSDSDIQSTLLRLLGFTNKPSSLIVLRREIENSDENIKLAAITGLSFWETPEPLNDLMNCMISAENDKIRGAALKGFTKFIDLDKNLTIDEKFNLYKKSLQYSKTGNEINSALDGIGRINKFESLEILKSYINQPQIARTVTDGITRVSWNLRNDHPEKIKEYITELLPQLNTVRFQTKSKNLLKEIEINQKSKKSN